MAMYKSTYSSNAAQEDYFDARHAQALAAWSYIGLVIPFIGWILAGLSLSTSKDLPTEGKVGRLRKSARSTATLSIFLSLVATSIWAVIAISFTNAPQQPVQTQQTVQEAQEQGPDANEAAIQECIDKAHEQWDYQIALAEGTPGNAYSFNKSQRDMQIANSRYQ